MWTPNFFECSDLFRPGPQRTVASDSSPPNYVLLSVPVGSRVAVRTLSGRGRWPSSQAPPLFFPFGGRRCCGAVGRCPTRPVLKHGPRSLTLRRLSLRETSRNSLFSRQESRSLLELTRQVMPTN
ncbi:hypothetical protein NPIL_401931 [Nephila pilipes]|uniref:Uncharacterized protein n=1 Tax=Nephila pilipes TaxID=299642 RepID=A0A8X6IKX8_NEPPI|nr:hypothetical protein NPIL_401931 [Nephila pilipes]